MVAWVFGGTPDAGDAELTAPAGVTVVWAIDSTPRMAAANIDTPPLCFCVLQCGLDLFPGMEWAFHRRPPV